MRFEGNSFTINDNKNKCNYKGLTMKWRERYSLEYSFIHIFVYEIPFFCFMERILKVSRLCNQEGFMLDCSGKPIFWTLFDILVEKPGNCNANLYKLSTSYTIFQNCQGFTENFKVYCVIFLNILVWTARRRDERRTDRCWNQSDANQSTKTSTGRGLLNILFF